MNAELDWASSRFLLGGRRRQAATELMCSGNDALRECVELALPVSHG